MTHVDAVHLPTGWPQKGGTHGIFDRHVVTENSKLKVLSHPKLHLHCAYKRLSGDASQEVIRGQRRTACHQDSRPADSLVMLSSTLGEGHKAILRRILVQNYNFLKDYIISDLKI